MRTTIDIPDAQYRQLKSRAATQGKTVKELVLRGVEVVLSDEQAPRPRRLKLPLIRSKSPGTLEMDNQRIYDLIGFP